MRDDLVAFVKHAEMATPSPLDVPVSWRLAE